MHVLVHTVCIQYVRKQNDPKGDGCGFGYVRYMCAAHEDKLLVGCTIWIGWKTYLGMYVLCSCWCVHTLIDCTKLEDPVLMQYQVVPIYVCVFRVPTLRRARS